MERQRATATVARRATITPRAGSTFAPHRVRALARGWLRRWGGLRRVSFHQVWTVLDKGVGAFHRLLGDASGFRFLGGGFVGAGFLRLRLFFSWCSQWGVI